MIELIPAIDIIDGKCVRLSQGDYNRQTIYSNDPLDVAKDFESHGLRRLHIVDLDGAASHHIVNYRTLERIASQTSLIIDFGGGIKSEQDAVIAFENGAHMITIGSAAITHPELLEKCLEKYGSQHLILGADSKDGNIAIEGWLTHSQTPLLDLLDTYIRKGITQALCTDINKDGMLQGPSVKLYQQIRANYPDLYLIASGGVSGIEDIIELDKAGVPAVVFGKALYEGKISLKELSMLL